MSRTLLPLFSVVCIVAPSLADKNAAIEVMRGESLTIDDLQIWEAR